MFHALFVLKRYTINSKDVKTSLKVFVIDNIGLSQKLQERPSLHVELLIQIDHYGVRAVNRCPFPNFQFLAIFGSRKSLYMERT